MRAWDFREGDYFTTCHTKRRGRVVRNSMTYQDNHDGVVVEFDSGERKIIHGNCLLKMTQRVH